MENASKALIIAGAILIAILLISVGIMVMNAVNKPIDQAGAEADQQAIQMFNAKFTPYAGEQSAANVKALMTSMISANRPFTITSGSIGSSLADIQSKVVSGNTYTVTFGYDTDGYLDEVGVK